MTLNSTGNSAAKGRQLLRAAVFLAAVACVFLLPYLFAPATGISMSYRVGFNNHVSIATLLLATLLFGVWTRGWGFAPAAADEAAEGTPTWFRAMTAALIALPFLLAVALWLRCAWTAPGAEANYFLDRYSMFTLGYRPFRTMTFDYGPLMFYPAVGLRAALHLSVGRAYFLSWTLQWLLGTAWWWDSVRRLPAPRVHRLAVFATVLVWLLPMLYSGGENYTPLRYVLAPWFALLVVRVQRRSVARALLLALLGCCVAGLYSPEQGIALALATVLFFALCVRGRAVWLPLAAFVVAVAAAVLAAKHLGLLQTMLDFGGGGYDMPLLAGWQTVTFVALLIIAGCVVLGGFFRGETNRPEPYLVAIALGLLPSALGRADAGHLLINSLAAILVALLALLRKPATRVPVAVVMGALAVQVLWTQAVPGFYRAFGPHLFAHARQMLHPPTTGDSPDVAEQRASLEQLLQAEGRPVLFSPLTYTQPYPLSHPLPIVTGRFFGFGLVSERFVQGKIDEIEQRRDPVLLLPAHYEGFCWTPDAPYIRGVLRDVLQPWYVPTVKHTGNAALPMCLYLRQHYTATPTPGPLPAGMMLVQRTDAFRSSR